MTICSGTFKWYTLLDIYSLADKVRSLATSLHWDRIDIPVDYKKGYDTECISWAQASDRGRWSAQK